MRVNDILHEGWFDDLKRGITAPMKTSSSALSSSNISKNINRRQMLGYLGGAGALGLGAGYYSKLQPDDAEEIDDQQPKIIRQQVFDYFQDSQLNLARRQLQYYQTYVEDKLIPKQRVNEFAIQLINLKLKDDPNSTAEEIAQFIAQVDAETRTFSSFTEKTGYETPSRLLSVYARTIAGKSEPKLSENEKSVALKFAKKFTDLASDVRAPLIANYMMAYKNKNGDFNSGDGWTYRGRGLLQITGRGNYRYIGRLIGVDLENNPDLVSINLDVAIKTGLEFWNSVVSPKIKTQRDWSDTVLITRIVKGSLGDVAIRQRKYAQWLPFVKKYINQAVAKPKSAAKSSVKK